jgi:hypothetical protein
MLSFFDDDPKRGRSAEVDYGTWWREEGRGSPHWRVSFVVATGELYAVCMAGPWCAYSGQVELLAVLPTAGDARATAAWFMAGWVEHHAEGNGLSWIRTQAHRCGVAA